MKGADTQKDRKEKGLDVAYSEDENDVGNIDDYEQFVETLVDIQTSFLLLREKAYCTIIVKI